MTISRTTIRAAVLLAALVAVAAALFATASGSAQANTHWGSPSQTVLADTHGDSPGPGNNSSICC